MKISLTLPILHNYNSYNYVKAKNNPTLHIQPTLSQDTVSFGRKKSNSLFLHDIREIPELPCAICGNPMIENSRVNKFLEEKIYLPAYTTFILAQKQGLNFNNESKVFRDVYEFMLAYSLKKKHHNLNDVYSHKQINEYRESLSDDGKAAFDKIKDCARKVSKSSSFMIREIAKLNPVFQETEYIAFNELKELSKIYPDENFCEILNKPEVKDVYLTRLMRKQLLVLENIERMKKNLPRRYQFELGDVIIEAKGIFTTESEQVGHKRKRAIAAVEKVLDRIKNNADARAIIEEINKLPDSKTDSDAFLIKSSQKTSNSLAETLVNRIRNTNEHVIPHHRVGNNGASNRNNYICLCGKCNNDRKMEEYTTVVEKHPYMPKNTQRQIDKVIQYINKGRLAGHDEYPFIIKEVLNIESGGTNKRNGKINIDVSRLDKERAVDSRKNIRNKMIEANKAKKSKQKINN